MSFRKIPLNLVGERYGRLVVLEESQRSGKGNYQRNWLCLCDCGIIKIVGQLNLRSENTSSCGCLNREICSDRMQGNGLGKSNKTTMESKLQKLMEVKTDYEVINSVDGKVMSKWLFHCRKCLTEFSCTYDCLIPKPSYPNGYTPCLCNYRGGFNALKPGEFYVIRLGDNSFKYGISNNTSKRFKQHEKNLSFEVFIIWNITDGRKCQLIEHVFDLVFTEKVGGTFPGYTETISYSNDREILQLFQYLVELDKDQVLKIANGLRLLVGKRKLTF